MSNPPKPFCYRDFDPTPAELIAYYLRNHILKKPYRESGTILEDTVYGQDLNPWEKFCNPDHPYPWVDTTSSPTLFLFTKVSDVGNTEKSSRFQKTRKAGCGTWHVTSSPISVTSFSGNGEVEIGKIRVMSFRSTNGQETVGQWTLYEYSISGEAFPEITKIKGWENMVVCKIKRDDSRSNIGGKLTKNRRIA